MTTETHTIRIGQHNVTRRFYAACTCGWSFGGDEETVHELARWHDEHNQPVQVENVTGE